MGVSVFYYKEAVAGPFGDEELDSYLRASNTALVFIGFSNNHMNHMNGLHDSILSLNLNLLNHNAYVRDLCDIELATEHSQVLTKHRLDEHRLVAYSNAMRLAGYYPTWLHSYNYHGHTYFMSIFELATDPIQLQFKLKKSASLSKMYRFISNNARDGYQVSLVQTLRSASHNDHLVYFVVVRRTAEPMVTMFNFQYQSADLPDGTAVPHGRGLPATSTEHPHIRAKPCQSELRFTKAGPMLVPRGNAGFYQSHPTGARGKANTAPK